MPAPHSGNKASACIAFVSGGERADIDEPHGFLCSLGASILRAPRENQWAPGHYSLLFEYPDGIILSWITFRDRNCWPELKLRTRGRISHFRFAEKSADRRGIA